MNDLHLRLRATLWWLLPLAALIVLVGLETDLGRGLHRRAAVDVPVVAKPVAVSLMPDYAIDGGIATHTDTINRPLFVPTRRPAPVAVVEVAKPRMQRGQYALTGTTVAGERSLAFLKEVSGGKSRTVKMGDTINGLLVAEVKPDRVKLTQGDESEELMLRVASNPRATPQPAAPQPGAQAEVVGQPAPQPGMAGAQDASGSLAERRRAARAAAAAAAAAAPPTETSMLPQSAPAGAPQAQAQTAPGTVQQPDTGWAAIYQRYQQRRN